LDSLLTSYVESCESAYSSIVQPGDSSENNKRIIISATWIKDEDIQRLLKSLPNWMKLLKAKESSKKMKENSIDEINSPEDEDTRTQNMRESDLLTGIFNGKTVQIHEILTEGKLFGQLAHFQESMVSINFSLDFLYF